MTSRSPPAPIIASDPCAKPPTSFGRGLRRSAGRTLMPSLHDLRIKLFADGADRAQMLEMHGRPHIRGLTTNPSLMRRAGVADYRAFAREVLAAIRDKPVCFEVLSDDLPEIERQALEIAGWADNVFVKVPVTNTRRQSCAGVIARLANRGVKINVTAILTLAQVRE